MRRWLRPIRSHWIFGQWKPEAVWGDDGTVKDLVGARQNEFPSNGFDSGIEGPFEVYLDETTNAVSYHCYAPEVRATCTDTTIPGYNSSPYGRHSGTMTGQHLDFRSARSTGRTIESCKALISALPTSMTTRRISRSSMRPDRPARHHLRLIARPPVAGRGGRSLLICTRGTSSPAVTRLRFATRERAQSQHCTWYGWI